MKKTLVFILFVAVAGFSLAEVTEKTNAQTPIIAASATNITETSATLTGQLDPNTGYNATVVGPSIYFEYGITSSFGLQTTEVSPQGNAAASLSVSNLAPGTTYYYRAVRKMGSVMNSNVFTDFSTIKTFTTEDATSFNPYPCFDSAKIQALEARFSNDDVHFLNDLFCPPVVNPTPVVIDPPVDYGHGYTPVSHIMRPGDRGEGVRGLQHGLNLALTDIPITIDGVYGPVTTQQVSTFQRLNGLTVDGKAGPMTQAALRDSITFATSPGF